MGRAPGCDKNGLKKGPWTPEEDQKLIDYIQKHGQGSWRTLPKNAGLSRCGKSCRLRWTNYLRPDIKRGRFAFEEEETIIQLHRLMGNKWSAIAGYLPGRTDNEIKNYWNTHIRKRLLRMGIDPVTHSPRLDLLDLSSLLTSSLYNPNKFDVSGLLGSDPLVNAKLLMLASTLISTQHQNPNILSQTLQENQFPNLQFQNPFHNFQTQQFQPAPIHEIPVCSTSNTQFLNETQFVHPKVEQLPSNSTNFSCQNVSQNLCQDPTVSSRCSNNEFFIDPNLDDYFNPQLNFCYPVTEPALDPICDNLDVQSNSNQSFQNFASVFSTHVSSPTPSNSPSTYVINSSTEDERDSYCSNMLNCQISELLYVNEFL